MDESTETKVICLNEDFYIEVTKNIMREFVIEKHAPLSVILSGVTFFTALHKALFGDKED